MDMLSGLGNINLDLGSIPSLPSIDMTGITSEPRQYPSVTEANKALEGIEIPNATGTGEKKSSANKKPDFNYANAGLKALEGATLGLGKQAFAMLQQKPLESLASIGAVGALALLGGAPAIFLMGALGTVGAKLAGFHQFTKANKKAEEARVAANEFRFEEAKQLMTESQAVWGNVGVAIGTAGVASLLAKRGLSANATHKGIQLAKGMGGFLKECFDGLIKPGYWASAPNAGNVLSANSTIIKAKTAEPLAKLAQQTKVLGTQAKAFSQQGQVLAKTAAKKGQAFVGQASQQGQEWLAKAKTQVQSVPSIGIEEPMVASTSAHPAPVFPASSS
jgi:hypothetical protein